MSILAGSLEFLGIGTIYPFLIILINPQTAVQNHVYQNLTLITHSQNISFNIIIIAVLIASIFFVKNLLMIGISYWQTKFVINWKNEINDLIMNYYLNIPYIKIIKIPISDKIYNISTLSSQALDVFVLKFLILMTNSIILFLILSLLFIKFFLVAIFVLTFISLSMLYLNVFFKKQTSKIAPKLLEASIANNERILENCSNLREVRIFSASDIFYSRFKETQAELGKVSLKSVFMSNLPPYLVEIILVFALILLAAVVAYQNKYDFSRIVASYGLILVVLFRLAPVLNRIQTALNNINSTKTIMQKMNELFEKNDLYYKKSKIDAKNKIKEFKKIRLDKINFGYDANKKVLKDITFEIKAGEFIGIIGLSGAGKTTLADILMGLLPPDSGKIRMNDTEITSQNESILSSLIGYVPQDMNLLNGSYKHNVAWGISDELVDESMVINCLKQAQIMDYIEKNGGINSRIDGLSYGQKQRILIARALYNNSEIILLDEATSSLDVETEHEIINMLMGIKGKKTIIAIAHRLITLKKCDRIIYLKEGEIVDIGRFEELSSTYKDFERLINLSKF
ncbi:ABC transporter ATP-binding protein [bacterium]|nr:ABC transporter ATP-binding protein [bacterium]